MPDTTAKPNPRPALLFDGTNLEDLLQLITLTELAILQDDDYNGNEPAKCARLAAQFIGTALSWVAEQRKIDVHFFDRYDSFTEAARNEFGATNTNLVVSRKVALENLQWDDRDVPLFFSEFDRLTRLLNKTSDDVRILLLTPKLPYRVRKLLSEQALDFANYGTMKSRLIVMWNLDPSRTKETIEHTSKPKRPKCGRCGKRGHKAAECRTPVDAVKVAVA